MANEVDRIQEQIVRLLSLGDIDAALRELKAWINVLLADDRILGNVFGSRELDRLCIQIGEASINSMAPAAASRVDASIDCIFVASELYMTGGHTALLEDYLSALAEKTTRVLITDPDNTVDRASIVERLSSAGCEVRFSPLGVSALSKLHWLIDELSKAKPDWTFFANHPNDPIAVAGMHESLSKHRAFVHHTDHTFTLGLFVDVDRHIDFRNKGEENCRQNLGIKNNACIPLSVPDKECLLQANRFLNDGSLVTCTSGNNKFEHSYSYQLEECIPQWLKASGGRHIHFGRLLPSTENAITHRLQELNIATDRLTVIPQVECLWKALLLHKVDFYIDSFPICGCRALVEVMGAGVPVAVHRNYRHRLFSNEGFVYEDAFIWSNPEELNHRLQSIDLGWLESQSLKARTYFLHNHTQKSLKVSLNDVLNEKTFSGAVQSENYQLDPLRAFLDSFSDAPPFENSLKAQRMLQLVSLAKAIDLPPALFEQTLESQTSPQELNRYKEYYKKLSNQAQVMDLIEGLYPIASDKQLDREKLSRLLFAVSQLECGIESSDKSRNSKLLHRYQSIFRRLVKIARSPK